MSKISLDLTGQWELKQYPLSARRMRDLDGGNWESAAVPSSIFESLIAADKIKRSDINANPEEFSWVSEKPWVYRKIFDVSEELIDCDRIDLVFDGLDTIASIWLNNKLVGRTNNMFIPFRFDVTKLLKPRNNTLLVKFEPAVQYAKKLMDRYTTFSESDFGNPYRVYIRKAQYQFGWDFCPALPGCGIWRPVRLEGIKKARLEDVHIRTVDCNHHYADIKVSAKLDRLSKERLLCKLTLSAAEQEIEYEMFFNPGEDSQSTVIRIEDPCLWWPAGYGQQCLYKISIELFSGKEAIDKAQKRFGIRTVKINRYVDEPSHQGKGADGERFQFEINGQDIFAKGANWIPASIFAGSVTSSDYEKLLLAAEKAGINMLRVWGGGYYETDEFYQLCDRLGIMVWQDFMFSSAYYPERVWFLKEVQNEGTAIIKRLRNHPCLALWCGNDEIDWMHSTSRLGKSKKFYGRAIYHRILPKLVAEMVPDCDYIPTTPLADKGKFKSGRQLTTHQWQVWSDYQPIRQYLCSAKNIPAFVTEFGLQSLPCLETVKSLCNSEQLRIGSYPIEKHNYQLDGNSRLYRYVCDLFGTAENLGQFVYLSQITQARAIKAYVEHLRAHNPGNNGVLFWHFNDCWPAIGFSAVDYAKEPKALYYYAKRFFSKRLIVVVPESEQIKTEAPSELQSINVVVINDSDEPLTAMLNCRLIDLFGNQIDKVAFPIAVASFTKSTSLKLPKAMICPSQPDKSCLHLVMDKDGEKIAENLFFYLPDKYISWPEVKISTRFSQITENKWKLKLKSDAIAKDVQISTNVASQFSDNFIDLVPWDEYEIIVDCQQQVCSLESGLQLRSLELTSM